MVCRAGVCGPERNRNITGTLRAFAADIAPAPLDAPLPEPFEQPPPAASTPGQVARDRPQPLLRTPPALSHRGPANPAPFRTKLHPQPLDGRRDCVREPPSGRRIFPDLL